jgi:formate hydrogenlyase transcriptional activator
MVEQKKFRSDLFYRLNVFPIRVPPLRERPDDIPLLVRHFAQHFAQRMNRRIESISSETMSALCNYRWPGNIRELQNVLERAVILSSGPVLRVVLSNLGTDGGLVSEQSYPPSPITRGTCGVSSNKPNDSGFWRPWMKPAGSLQVQGAPPLTWG